MYPLAHGPVRLNPMRTTTACGQKVVQGIAKLNEALGALAADMRFPSLQLGYGDGARRQTEGLSLGPLTKALQ
jgi:hypothetical protein